MERRWYPATPVRHHREAAAPTLWRRLDTIEAVSRGWKLLLVVIALVFAWREWSFRRNLSEFNPDTAPTGD